MKIRKGFVSNSSSSSFTVIGWKVSIKEIDDEHVKLYCPDRDYEEGELYFRPSADIIKYIKENSDIDHGTFFYELIGGESLIIEKQNLIKLIESCPDKNIEVMSINVSHYEPDLEDFMERVNYED